jgi:hypothetical protein
VVGVYAQAFEFGAGMEYEDDDELRKLMKTLFGVEATELLLGTH